MNEPTDTIHHLAAEIARFAITAIALAPQEEKLRRLQLALDQLRPGLFQRVLTRAAELERMGYLPLPALERSLVRAISDLIMSEIGRTVAPLPCTTARLGLGECSLHGGWFGLGASAPPVEPPEVQSAQENDDLVRHNKIPPRYDDKATAAWEERQYRGLWYPAYKTAIVALTPDDVAMATAFVGGKLTRKDCPPTQTEQEAMDEANKWKKVFDVIEEIAGMIATIVMGIIYGPLAGAVVNLAHQGKMWLIHEVWKDKVQVDPQAKTLIEKMRPAVYQSYKYGSFRYYMLPIPIVNMMVQELGCKADLMTRLLLHGRMLRTIDAMQAAGQTLPTPWLYSYPSAFGMLHGSIFPPRGPAYDGVPPPEAVKKQVRNIMKTRLIRSVLKADLLSPSQAAGVVPAPSTPAPADLSRSAEVIRARVADIRAAEAAHLASEKNDTNYLPYAVAGGGALALLLALAHRRANA